MKLTKYGKKEWMTASVILLFLLVLSGLLILFTGKIAVGAALGVFFIVMWLLSVAFFRDPERRVPESVPALVSPADGVVKDIELIPNAECGNSELSALFEGKDMLRIGIFLSVFDVHLNRAPCSLEVKFTSYREGMFHDARDGRASRENESLILGGTGKVDREVFPVAVRQISGAIARRIVCEAAPGDKLSTGQRYGMIKFGSRTELYLPVKSSFELCVAVGDRVAAGESIIAAAGVKVQTQIINITGQGLAD